MRISALALVLLLAGCADTRIPAQPRATDPVIGLGARGPLGTVLTADGVTVYVYTKDPRGATVCYDLCAMDWPPVLVTHTPAVAAPLPGRLGSVSRRDGTRQLTYDGHPLYRYIEDPPGTDQANGQDVDHEWFVVRP
jgi:predicted lipoprotein with Yx(FWY)xxD motif